MSLTKEIIDGITAIIVEADIHVQDKHRFLEALGQCKEEYVIDTLTKEWIEEMGFYSESGDFERLGSKMSEAYNEQDKALEFNALVELCGFEKHKKCHCCGKTVVDGFHALDTKSSNHSFYDIYLCSGECKDKIFTEEEWKTLSEENPEEYYYSEWR